MKPGRTTLAVLGILLLTAENALASNGDDGGGGRILLEFVGLGLSFGCLIVSWKVLSFVRGGRLAAPWQWLTTAFLLFAIAQVLAILSYIVLPSAGGNLVEYLRILGFLLLLMGIIKMRKVLA
jgi:hypothetical protein